VIGRLSARWLATAICAVVAIAMLDTGAPLASAASSDPIFEYMPIPPPPLSPPLPPPNGRFYDPCGLAVDSEGFFYVSDYYHDTIDIYQPNSPSYTNPSSKGEGFITQLKGMDASDGPCGLAVDETALYANDYHRAVFQYGTIFDSGTPITGNGVDSEHPTGVAVDLATSNVYVDDRDHVAVYDASGNPVDDGGNPLEIGTGSLNPLEDGYGVAVSRFPGSVAFPTPTAGYVYVPDAATNTIKVYDPAIDKANPIDEIDGADTPGGGFVSLRDAAIAVDDATGEIYVIDNTQPDYAERPQAIVQVFAPTGAWEGNLKYKITDGLPAGLAVDNSGGPTQSRVYVTSGNSTYITSDHVDSGGIYAYGPGAATKSTPLTPKISPPFVQPGGGSPTGGLTFDQSTAQNQREAPSASASPPTAEASVVTQRNNLRLSVNGKVSPKRLPRESPAPIAVSVNWNLATTDGSQVPKLKNLQIEINRDGNFDATGLPVCSYPKIQPATASRALAGCRGSVVGSGSVKANVAVEGQEAYPATGTLTIFNGERKGKPVLYGHIYSSRPFAISFVIVFTLVKQRKGTYGTIMSGTLPRTLRNWGNLTALQMTLSRHYHYKGQSRSFASAACAAPKGFNKVTFPLARASFGFEGAPSMSSVLNGDCSVRGQ
jgi:hypothetical protein